MKSASAIVWIPFALLAGLLLGGWGPRAEVRRLQAELAWVRQQQNQPRQPTLDSISRMLAPEHAVSFGNTEPQSPQQLRESAENAPPAGDSDMAPASESVRRSFQERIEVAAEAWRLRSDLARDHFITQARLTVSEAAQFDVLIEAMNLRMLDQIQALAGWLESGEPLTPEDGVRLIHEMTGIVKLTYDEMDRTLPATWRAGTGPDFDLAGFIDPMVGEPLFGLENKLRQSTRGRRRWDRPPMP